MRLMGNNFVNLANGETIIDLRHDTINPEVVFEGYTGHDSQGEPFVGTAVSSGGGGEDKILRVTATATPETEMGGVLDEVSHTFQEIQDAYNNGKTIFFNVNAGKIETNTDFVMPLQVIRQNSHVACSTILDMSGMLTYIQFFILASNESSFIIKFVSNI